MLSAALITISLVIAYVIVASLMTASTFALVSFNPQLPVQGKRLSKQYNFLQDLLWLFFALAGGYVAVAGSAEASPRLAALLLVAILLAVVWSNQSETRQRGLIHMLLTSLGIIIGVSLGYLLWITT